MTAPDDRIPPQDELRPEFSVGQHTGCVLKSVKRVPPKDAHYPEGHAKAGQPKPKNVVFHVVGPDAATGAYCSVFAYNPWLPNSPGHINTAAWCRNLGIDPNLGLGFTVPDATKPDEEEIVALRETPVVIETTQEIDRQSGQPRARLRAIFKG